MNKNFISNKSNNDDDMDDDNIRIVSSHLPFYESTRTNRSIKVYLDEGIREAKYYRTILQGMDTLSEGDLVLFSINSYGGQLDGAIALINAIESTQADVHASIEGIAASAASMIALAAPNLSVAPYATMMVHCATFGAFGKQSDVMSHASFVDKQVRTIMGNVYKDFLTDKELEEMFVGKEFWFDADEIVLRLDKRCELQDKREKALNKAAGSKKKIAVVKKIISE
jgi:ATP-dependent protease ClpP protease subunit